MSTLRRRLGNAVFAICMSSLALTLIVLAGFALVAWLAGWSW